MKITHDFHVHTKLSICANETATVENYIAHAKRLGLKKIGFSDHFGAKDIPNARGFYRAHPYEHNAQLKDTLSALKEPDIQFYFGCETEYHTPKRDIALTEEEAEKFDFITVPNSHTHMVMPKDYIGNYEKHIAFMIQAYEDILNSPLARYVTAMAHPFDICCSDYLELALLVPDCHQFVCQFGHCFHLLLRIGVGDAALFVGWDYHFLESGHRQYHRHGRPYPASS